MTALVVPQISVAAVTPASVTPAALGVRSSASVLVSLTHNMLVKISADDYSIFSSFSPENRL